MVIVSFPDLRDSIVQVVAFSRAEFDRRVSYLRSAGYVMDSCGAFSQRFKFGALSRYTATMVLEAACSAG